MTNFKAGDIVSWEDVDFAPVEGWGKLGMPADLAGALDRFRAAQAMVTRMIEAHDTITVDLPATFDIDDLPAMPRKLGPVAIERLDRMDRVNEVGDQLVRLAEQTIVAVQRLVDRFEAGGRRRADALAGMVELRPLRARLHRIDEAFDLLLLAIHEPDPAIGEAALAEAASPLVALVDDPPRPARGGSAARKPSRRETGPRTPARCKAA